MPCQTRIVEDEGDIVQSETGQGGCNESSDSKKEDDDGLLTGSVCQLSRIPLVNLFRFPWGFYTTPHIKGNWTNYYPLFIYLFIYEI